MKIPKSWLYVRDRFYVVDGNSIDHNQNSTNDSFSEKWVSFAKEDDVDKIKLDKFQRNWFLDLYGFESEDELKAFLQNRRTIVDMGCGLGYKSYWLSQLAPESTIIAIDYSNAVVEAHKKFARAASNIVFVQGDIANSKLEKSSIDLIVCDQVIMHTTDPRQTLIAFGDLLQSSGDLLCYWYRKKALPRELLDDYFRDNVQNFSKEQLWQLSEELLQLGKMLSDLQVRANFPSVPALGIKGGEMDLQRFIYWNFIKCFWNSELGHATSLATNFDWYSPKNAKRFSKMEVYSDLEAAGLIDVFFHEEPACYSGRFRLKV